MYRKLHHILSVAVTGLLCILTGCDEQTVFHTYLPVSSQGWEKGDTLVFHTDTIRKEGDYAFNLELRSTDKYPYQSVWLVVERKSGNAQDFIRDTVECRLTDKETHRMGDGIHTYQYIVELPALYLPAGQPAEIRVRHHMHRETLTGLHDIGIHIIR